MTDVKLPMAVSLKWVAYACRMAGATKPRWSREAGTWTTTVARLDVEPETITISLLEADLIRIDSTSDHARAIISNLHAGMRAHAHVARTSSTMYAASRAA